MPKIAKIAERFIAANPEVQDCLSMDMINYSKLARKISMETGAKSIPAIVAACRRHAEKLRMMKQESGIGILKKSKKRINIEGQKANITLTVNEKNLSKVLEAIR